MSEHTSTPWDCLIDGTTASIGAQDNGRRIRIASICGNIKNPDIAADAALIVRAVNSLASNEAKIDALEKELEALRKVGWCAQALLSADEIKHPTLSRADAVAEADKRLRQQLGKWQMEFCASKAALSSHTEQEGGGA